MTKRCLLFFSLLLSIGGLKVQNAVYRAFLDNLYSKFEVEHIGVDSLRKLLVSGMPVILDVRSAEEFAVSHIRNARQIDYDRFLLDSVADIDKKAKIIVYCSVGHRSSVIAEKMKKAGYRDVSNLYGGIFAWVNEGAPVFRSSRETNEIHPYDGVWGLWLKRGKKTFQVD